MTTLFNQVKSLEAMLQVGCVVAVKQGMPGMQGVWGGMWSDGVLQVWSNLCAAAPPPLRSVSRSVLPPRPPLRPSNVTRRPW